MFNDFDSFCLVLVPALPLLAALLTWILGPRFLKEHAHLPAVAGVGASFVLSLVLLFSVYSQAPVVALPGHDDHGGGHGAAGHAAPAHSTAATHGTGESHGTSDAAATGDSTPAATSESTAEATTSPAAASTAESTATPAEPETPAAAPRATVAKKDPAKPLGYEKLVTLWTWVDLKDAFTQSNRSPGLGVIDAAGGRQMPVYPFTIDITLRLDPLTSIMLATVTFVGLLVVIYSIGYMHHDPGYWRYFAYVAVFVFSMTMLVASSNFLLLYVFWEGVGACSYLLIGFWYTRDSAANAGVKAFLVNRIGDIGLALAIFLMWTSYGTLNFHDVYNSAGEIQSAGLLSAERLTDHNGLTSPGLGVTAAIAILLLVGACGKSAQFPLHVWLPDAMEGPTPASALIHAATMVTAGVYLTARASPFFVMAQVPGQVGAMYLVSAVGMFTALLAALIALTQTDLKRVLAYSTVSQLGFMFMGIGAGTLAGVTAGMFHLFTHAWFKALLFLGAGSVMHAMGGVIDMNKFGGLRRLMPTTCWTFAIGSLGLAGFPFLAGFFSKDEILAALYTQSEVAGGEVGAAYRVIVYLGLFAAFLTAFYTSRAFFLAFYGPERIPEEAGHHAHESPAVMTGPMIVLAIGTCIVGWFGHEFAQFLAATPSLAWLAQREIAAAAASTATHAAHDHHTFVAACSIVIALSGIGLAAFCYLVDRSELDYLGRFKIIRLFQQASYRKFYIDEIYQMFIVWPTRILASLMAWLDRVLVDGIVDLVGKIPPVTASLVRMTGTGMVQFYALAMVVGVLTLIVAAGILDQPPTPPAPPVDKSVTMRP